MIFMKHLISFYFISSYFGWVHSSAVFGNIQLYSTWDMCLTIWCWGMATMDTSIGSGYLYMAADWAQTWSMRSLCSNPLSYLHSHISFHFKTKINYTSLFSYDIYNFKKFITLRIKTTKTQVPFLNFSLAMTLVCIENLTSRQYGEN